MKKTILSINALIVSLLALLLVSCGESSISKSYVSATGAPAELMLVMDAEHLNTSTGYKVYDVLSENTPSLNQPEVMFKVSRTTSKNFESFLRYVRNILMVDINKDRYTKSTVKFSYDQWAKGQIVVQLNTPTPDSLESFLDKNKEMLSNLFVRNELFRFAEQWAKGWSKGVDERTMKLFEHHYNVPEDIKSYKVGKDFLWMSNNQSRRRKDILVYSFPYRSKADLAIDRMVEVRDSVLKANIEGSNPNAYPSTEKHIDLFHRYVYLGEEKRAELRGLWKMEGGDMMSGPFVQQALVSGDKVYVVEGFVYNPNEDKRNLMRMMEATLYSFRPASVEKFNPELIKKARWTPLR